MEREGRKLKFTAADGKVVLNFALVIVKCLGLGNGRGNTVFKFIKYNFRHINAINRNKLSFKTYLKFSALKAVGGLMFYLGFAVIGVGVAFGLIFRFNLLNPVTIIFVVVGIVLSVSGYFIHSYSKFRENAEQIARGVSTGIQNVPNESNTIPPPPSNLCPTCRHPLTFIEQYKAWYCFNCKEYK